MKPTPASCAVNLIELASVIIHEMRRTIRLSKGLQITLVQARVLAVTNRQRGSSVSDIAGHVGLGFSATSTLVDGLVRRKLLSRGNAAEDRRRAVLAPTPAGEAILRQVRRLSSQQLAKRIGRLSAPDLAAIAQASAALRPILIVQNQTAGASHG